MTDDERAIRDLVETWMTATRAGDIHTVLDFMTDDAIFMTPGNPPFGKEAFKEAAEDMKAGTTDGPRYEGTSRIEEIKVLGQGHVARKQATQVGHQVQVPAHRRSGPSGYEEP